MDAGGHVGASGGGHGYGDAGTASVGIYWAILIAFAVVFLIGTWVVLVRSTRRATR